MYPYPCNISIWLDFAGRVGTIRRACHAPLCGQRKRRGYIDGGRLGRHVVAEIQLASLLV